MIVMTTSNSTSVNALFVDVRFIGQPSPAQFHSLKMPIVQLLAPITAGVCS